MYSYGKKVDPRLSDPVSGLPVAFMESARNLEPTFLTMPVDASFVRESHNHEWLARPYYFHLELHITVYSRVIKTLPSNAQRLNQKTGGS